MLTVVLLFEGYNEFMLNEEEYFENWPDSYYEIKDARVKERVLKKHMEQFHLEEDEQRLVIFKKRYKHSYGSYVDQFIQSFLSLQKMTENKMNLLNRNKYNDEVVVDLMNLCLYEEPTDLLKIEWQYFLKDYIEASYKSFSRPAFLGMGKRSEEVIWDTVKKNLESMLKILPHTFLLDDKCKILYDMALEQVNKSSKAISF